MAGTGSRTLQTASTAHKHAAAASVRAALAVRRARHGDRLVVMSGMAEGFDKLIALSALRAGIRLWCAIPNRGYGAYYWGDHSLTGSDRRGEFERIVAAAWRVTYVMEDVHGVAGSYLGGKHANFVRNDFMVAHADEFLVWNPTTPGTRQCLAAIRTAGVPFEILSA